MRMGYLGVKTIVASIRKQPFEKHIDTGVTMVTPDNLDSAETQAIVNPPIAKYIGGT
jgi:ribose transport system substrate-binding protein